MRITLDIEGEMLEEAQRLTGISNKTKLVEEGLRVLIERGASVRLARLGGSEPQLKKSSRRKSAASL